MLKTHFSVDGNAMEVVEGAEHYFHKLVELERLRSWLRRALISN